MTSLAYADIDTIRSNKAVHVRIDDVGGYYTADTVEGALQSIADGGFGFHDLLPDVDNTYDVGSDSLRWKDGYFGGDVKVDGDIEGGGRTIKLSPNKIIFDN